MAIRGRFSAYTCHLMTLAVLLLAGFTSGCIAVNEQSIAPLSMPAAFSMSGNIELQDRWWLDFQDPHLSTLIDKALKDNFNLRTAFQKLEEAKALARIAGAPLVPSIDGRGIAFTNRDINRAASAESYLLALAASYEIDFWGRLRAKRDAALLDAGATLEDYDTAAVSLAAEVATTWYLYAAANLQQELLREQQETNTKILELITFQFRAGQVGIADVLQQRQLVEKNLGDMAALRADIKILEHQLAILLGTQPGTELFMPPDRLPDPAPLPSTGIPLDLLAKRPDIRSSYLKLKATDYRVAAAVADRLPRISISAELSTSGERAGDLLNNWFSSLSANLFGPIIDGGQRKAEVARTEAVAKQQFYRHCQLILEAVGEVEDALMREREQLLVLDSQKNQLRLATETIEHVANRYRQGGEDYQRVLLALLSQQNLQQSLIASRRNLLNIRIALYRALSGRIPAQNEEVTEDGLLPGSSPP